MNILLRLDDAKLFDLSKMPNIPALLDRAYKESRGQMIIELAHERKVFVAFDAWFISMTPDQRENVMKSLKSTISLDEIIPQNLRDRDLIMEAASRYRENMITEENNSSEEQPQVETAAVSDVIE